jgi:hypothetical protein
MNKDVYSLCLAVVIRDTFSQFPLISFHGDRCSQDVDGAGYCTEGETELCPWWNNRLAHRAPTTSTSDSFTSQTNNVSLFQISPLSLDLRRYQEPMLFHLQNLTNYFRSVGSRVQQRSRPKSSLESLNLKLVLSTKGYVTCYPCPCMML